MNKRVETLYKKYGRDYFSKIGKLGAKSLWERYKKMPIGIGEYILVRKENIK